MLGKSKCALLSSVAVGLTGATIALPSQALAHVQESVQVSGVSSASAAAGIQVADSAAGQSALQQPPSDATSETEPAAASSQEGQASEVPGASGDIVVTAQRRAENLQDVPLAITAVTPEAATAMGLRNLTDITLATPGVDLAPSTNFAMMFIRGIGVQYSTPGREPPVAVYVDNTYISQTGGLISILDLVDPGTIEIIRGPQGTLYGRNATGGVVRISSANPTDEFEGRVLAEYGRFDHRQLDAMLNVPVSNDLSVRFAGRVRKADGYIDNFDGADIGEVNNYTARGRVRWNPTNSIDIVGGVEWQRSNARTYTDRLGLGAPSCTVCNFTGEEPPEGFHEAAINSERFPTRSFRADLRGSVEVGDVELTSTTTYYNTNNSANADNDFTSSPVFFYHVLRQGGKSFGQEFQLSYDADSRLSFISAISYLRDKSYIDFALEGSAYQFAADAVGVFPENYNDITTTSWAGLLEGVYRLTDTLKVTLGGRYTRDKRRQLSSNNAGFQLFGAPVSHSANDSEDAFTPRFVLAWDNGPTNVFYSYTRGFKAGGFVTPAVFPAPTVRPEKVFNHEVGVKHRTLGGLLNFSLSAFYYKNKGLQQQIIDASGSGTITENAGAAEGYGAELEVNARPLDGLVLGGSVGYLHAEYSDYRNAAIVCFDPTLAPNATLVPCRTDLTGTVLPHAPKWTLGATASYRFAIGSWSANLAGLAQYRSTQLFWPGAGGELGFDKQKGYTIANISGYVSPPGDNLRLGFYVDNVLNTDYAHIRTTSAGWGAAVAPARPITYGVRVGYQF